MHASFWSRINRYNRYVEMLVELGRIDERDVSLVGPTRCTRGGCAERLGAIPRWCLGTNYPLCPTHVEAMNADRRLRRWLDNRHGGITPAQGWALVRDAAANIAQAKRMTRRERAAVKTARTMERVRSELGDEIADAIERRMRRTP